jgi:hypothetical protein
MSQIVECRKRLGRAQHDGGGHGHRSAFAQHEVAATAGRGIGSAQDFGLQAMVGGGSTKAVAIDRRSKE